jgi:methylated-DNA-[protein]-cysteine S-methyltransferase
MNAKIIPSTPLGPVVVIWDRLPGGPRVCRILLSKPGATAGAQAAALYPGAPTGSCREMDVLAASILGFLEGEPVRFSLDLTAMDTRPAFQQAVLRAEHGIPRGRVSTYGLIAAHLGARQAARAVGQALATNPFPIIVPCHRAVRSDGGLGGFQGGPAMKRALLEREGIPFDRAGRVAVARFHYS